jgi:hypothetical protein
MCSIAIINIYICSINLEGRIEYRVAGGCRIYDTTSSNFTLVGLGVDLVVMF